MSWKVAALPPTQPTQQVTCTPSDVMQAAIQDRFEAWAPLTEAQFIAYTPRRMQEEQDAARAEERVVALRPAHFALPVPPHRGQQRVVMHDIMKQPPNNQHKPVKKAGVGCTCTLCFCIVITVIVTVFVIIIITIVIVIVLSIVMMIAIIISNCHCHCL